VKVSERRRTWQERLTEPSTNRAKESKKLYACKVWARRQPHITALHRCPEVGALASHNRVREEPQGPLILGGGGATGFHGRNPPPEGET
jgi:hypothetical protein